MVIEYILIVTIYQQMAVKGLEEGFLFVSGVLSVGQQPIGLGQAHRIFDLLKVKYKSKSLITRALVFKLLIQVSEHQTFPLVKKIILLQLKVMMILKFCAILLVNQLTNTYSGLKNKYNASIL